MTPPTVQLGRALFGVQAIISGPTVAVVWLVSFLGAGRATAVLPGVRLFSWWAEVLVVVVPVVVFITSLGVTSLSASTVTWLEMLWLTAAAVVSIPPVIAAAGSGALGAALWAGLALLILSLVLPATALGLFVVPDASRRYFAGVS